MGASSASVCTYTSMYVCNVYIYIYTVDNVSPQCGLRMDQGERWVLRLPLYLHIYTVDYMMYRCMSIYTSNMDQGERWVLHLPLYPHIYIRYTVYIIQM